MKVPEPLFAIINPLMKFLLRSPLHHFWSYSLMLITFVGRKSGRIYTTPVRFIRNGEAILCFTSAENQWWRNLRGGSEVRLLVGGKEGTYYAEARREPGETKKLLIHYLGLFPQDAVYHDIRLHKDKSLNLEDLEHAARKAVVVKATVARTPADP